MLVFQRCAGIHYSGLHRIASEPAPDASVSEGPHQGEERARLALGHCIHPDRHPGSGANGNGGHSYHGEHYPGGLVPERHETAGQPRHG